MSCGTSSLRVLANSLCQSELDNPSAMHVWSAVGCVKAGNNRRDTGDPSLEMCANDSNAGNIHLDDSYALVQPAESQA